MQEIIDKQAKLENEFFHNIQNDINKLILMSWDGNKLKEDEKKYVSLHLFI